MRYTNQSIIQCLSVNDSEFVLSNGSKSGTRGKATKVPKENHFVLPTHPVEFLSVLLIDSVLFL